MPSRKDSPNRSETFGRLLSGAINSIATYEGRTTPVVEEELGQLLTLSGKTIQRYKSGHLPPEHETVKVLAEAAIQRGYLGREWLQRFLHAARYPFADTLLDQLRPIGPARLRPPRVYENLPAPTYSQFVMRAQAFAEVIDGLQQRSAIVLIVGLGGNGKTSLAREVAAHCLTDDNDAPRFDAAVWVSDKDHPGTTNLSVVLDEIARTLDYPGFAQFEHEEKRREVEQLLKRQRVLVIVDNFETITDGALLAWLLRMPEPSKALITSREKQRGLWSSWLAELRGMSEAEAQTLIGQRLRALQLDKLVKNPVEFEPLVAVTGGNPKAIEIALGLVKHEHRPLQQVVDDLYAARGDLFDDLFTRAWALLDEAARRVLLVMTFFPTSTSGEALAATADVQEFAFDRAVERLTDLALLDVQQADFQSAPRYTLHPLVRAFIGARVVEQTGFAAAARQRWMEYFFSFARQHSPESRNEVLQQDLYSLEQELVSLHAVVQYCADMQYWDRLIDMVFKLNRLWSSRGYYEDRNRLVALAQRAAEYEHNMDDQIGLLCIQVRTLCYLNEPQQAIACCMRARALLATLAAPPDRLEQNINYSQIRAHLLLEDYEPIHVLALRNVALSASPYTKNLYSYDIVEYYDHVGRHIEALSMVRQLLAASLAFHDRRGDLRGSLIMARIALDHGQFDHAAEYLSTAKVRATELHHRRFFAEVMRLYARLYTLRGDHPAARVSLAEAIDRFERLGMRRELAEAREALADLDAHEIAEAK